MHRLLVALAVAVCAAGSVAGPALASSPSIHKSGSVAVAFDNIHKS
ncbi:hypothetical protein IV500_17680 [Paeniglutamicibacter antarcticus]|uniref:Uncharacterized protein n=1 Tax=Arthrobacter terrae TaxID=2935737 RepID=A0A931CS29_9MICC|nr:hypothetical protein [Arthrobacter terrae]MBG0741201.1 hypothetical protein [Arthrobacter terrae]